MTDDLSTLLRDAGREPTVDLDVDAVHARGRRRTVGRYVAVGAGALALLGVVAIGIVGLQPDPSELGPIDEAPPTEAPDVAPVRATTPRAALAAELRRDVHLHRYEADRDTWVLERTRTDGTTDARELTLPPMLAEPVVDREGRVWTSDADGTLLLDGELPEQDPEVARSWLPVGTTGDGIAVVVDQPRPDGSDGRPVLREVGPSGIVTSSVLDLVAAALPTEAAVFRFAEGAEHGVVLGSVASQSSDGDGQLVLLVPYGEAPRDLLGEVPVADAVGGGTVVAIGVVADEVWLAVASSGDTVNAGTSSIVRVPLDPAGTVTFLPTPDPAGMQRVDGTVTSIEASADGEVVLLGRRDDEAFLPPLVVRPAMADEFADGAITELDAPGVPTLLPATGESEVAAACAADDDERLNAAPSGSGGQVWWLCWDAVGQLDDGVAHPFVAVEVLPGGDGSVDAVTVQSALDAWAAGPAAHDVPVTSGITGILDPEVVRIGDVRVDPDDDSVTVDLLAGPQVGVLGTTTGGATFVQGLVGTALQYDTLSTVTITLDGSCEDWVALANSESDDPGGCRVYDRSFAPWNQGGGVTDLSTTDLDDGRHPVYLHALDVDARTLTFDLVQFLTGEEASAAWDGEDDGPPNDYLVVNENARLRTLAVAGDVTVEVVDLAGTGTAESGPATWSELPDYLAGGPAGEGGSLWYAPFWLTLEDGIVIAIEEQYIP